MSWADVVSQLAQTDPREALALLTQWAAWECSDYCHVGIAYGRCVLGCLEELQENFE